ANSFWQQHKSRALLTTGRLRRTRAASHCDLSRPSCRRNIVFTIECLGEARALYAEKIKDRVFAVTAEVARWELWIFGKSRAAPKCPPRPCRAQLTVFLRLTRSLPNVCGK